MRISDWSSDVCSSDLMWRVLLGYLVKFNHQCGLSQKSFDEFLRNKWLQILDLLPDADKVDRNRARTCNRCQHAAFCRAVQFGHDHAGDRKSTRLNSSN